MSNVSGITPEIRRKTQNEASSLLSFINETLKSKQPTALLGFFVSVVQSYCREFGGDNPQSSLELLNKTIACFEKLGDEAFLPIYDLLAQFSEQTLLDILKKVNHTGVYAGNGYFIGKLAHVMLDNGHTNDASDLLNDAIEHCNEPEALRGVIARLTEDANGSPRSSVIMSSILTKYHESVEREYAEDEEEVNQENMAPEGADSAVLPRRQIAGVLVEAQGFTLEDYCFEKNWEKEEMDAAIEEKQKRNRQNIDNNAQCSPRSSSALSEAASPYSFTKDMHLRRKTNEAHSPRRNLNFGDPEFNTSSPLILSNPQLPGSSQPPSKKASNLRRQREFPTNEASLLPSVVLPSGSRELFASRPLVERSDEYRMPVHEDVVLPSSSKHCFETESWSPRQSPKSQQ